MPGSARDGAHGSPLGDAHGSAPGGGRDGDRAGTRGAGGGPPGNVSRDAPRGWREAAEAALYGPGGFYHRPEGPAGHFRTSVHVSGLFAEAVARMLCRVDEALGHPAELAFVDLGAGGGELVTGVLGALPGDVASRARGYAIERSTRRPAAEATGRTQPHDARITWATSPPRGVTGLLFANEWLDNIPLDVVETDADCTPRHVLVHHDGTETLGAPLGGGPDARWLRRWWPTRPRPGLRAEIGRPRDAAWAAAVDTLSAGCAVAADYVHVRASRPPNGTLSGFRAGRQVAPVPDGSCDITAHVAVDACAAAGGEARTSRTPAVADPAPGSGAPAGPVPPGPVPSRPVASRPVPRLMTQRAALHALGLTGGRPPLALAAADPAAYVRALAAAGEAAELTARGGLGDFGWLVQPVAMPHLEGLPPGMPLDAPPDSA